MRSLVLSDEVKYVGAYAFSGCSFLTDVRVDGECVIGKGAFFVSTELSEVRLPHVTEIGAHAFSGCDELYMAVLPEKAPVLGEYAFDGTSAAVLYPMGGTGYDDPSFSDVYTEEYIPGDVDGDGICNIGDVTHLLKYIAGWNDISLRRYSADVNTDRKNDINDVLDILKYIAQWDIVMGISL